MRKAVIHTQDGAVVLPRLVLEGDGIRRVAVGIECHVARVVRHGRIGGDVEEEHDTNVAGDDRERAEHDFGRV